MNFDATSTPQDIVSVLGLVAGREYPGQNVSLEGAVLLIKEQAVVPDEADRAFRVASDREFFVKPEGNPIWVWTQSAAGCPAVIGEPT